MESIFATYNIILIVLGILVLLFAYTSFNLLKKLEKLEDIVESQDSIIMGFESVVNSCSKRLEEIDAKGTFKSDDEIGWFFSEIKKIQNIFKGFWSGINNNGN